VRRAAAVPVLFATTAALAAVPSPAWAADDSAPRVVSVSAPSAPIVLRAVGTTPLVIRARVTDNVGVKKVLVGLDDAGAVYDEPTGFGMTRVSGTVRDGVWEANLTVNRLAAVGGWTVRLYAVDAAGNVADGVMKVRDTFTVKYRTRILNFNGSPEPVADGAAATFTGALDRVSATGWVDAANRTVALQFRKKGTTKWVTRKTGTTQENGTFRFKARVYDPGAWRAVFAGSATLAASVSDTDSIALS
jgi:hypothetical protein